MCNKFFDIKLYTIYYYGVTCKELIFRHTWNLINRNTFYELHVTDVLASLLSILFISDNPRRYLKKKLFFSARKVTVRNRAIYNKRCDITTCVNYCIIIIITDKSLSVYFNFLISRHLIEYNKRISLYCFITLLFFSVRQFVWNER